jgi:hypothetical protein
VVNEDAESETAKKKFREALERKRGRQPQHQRASQKDSKVHHAHSAEGGKRQFRRKAGPS